MSKDSRYNRVLQCTEHFTKRPVWAEIDLDAAAYNMQHIRQAVGKHTLIMAVVKANAYGCGAVTVSRIFLQNGADQLAVACLDEALELRHAGISAPILVLGHTDGRRAEEVVRNHVDVAVFHYDDARLFSEAAVRLKQRVRFHIAIDSGMGRIGYNLSANSIDEIRRIRSLPCVVMEGLFTHFAVADDEEVASASYTNEQFLQFTQFYQSLWEEGVSFRLRHCDNSAGIMAYPSFFCNMVRPGIVQYGYNPFSGNKFASFVPRPVMSLRCGITHVKQVDIGETIGYGRQFTAQRPTVVATLPLGYADGYSRLLSNKSDILVHGQRVPQIGNICMDQCMIDVTDVPGVCVGDECVLFGIQEQAYIGVDELSKIIGTIPHEILCNINRRVPRVYVKDGVCVKRIEYISSQV